MKEQNENLPKEVFEFGEEIEVRDYDDENWYNDMYFIARLENGFVIVVDYGEGVKNILSENTSEINSVNLVIWKQSRKIQKELVPNIEINVKINGKESNLKDISDETWMNIKNNSK
ncbi:MAG: hypothetical protein H8E98_05295 [Bacteroidetes bacterium]|nr:hypothetical protein [Bacteroidota bacterium]